MVENIMENYIKITQKFLKDFTKLFFMEFYYEDISNEFISTYIDARIYNYGVDKYSRYFYRRIYANLVNKKKELEAEDPKADKELLNKYLKMYQYIFYLDGVRKMPEQKGFTKIICEKRMTKLELPRVTGIEAKMNRLIKSFDEKKEAYLKSFESEDFEIETEKYTLIENSYKVDLKFKFKIPYIYSDKAITEVFNEGLIFEDKLIIEYLLLAVACIRDINQGNFAKKYIVDFAESLLPKQKKMNTTLKALNSPAIQDKVMLKITNNTFEENKELIYSLIKDGFKFALIIDDSVKENYLELKKLAIFDYMLVPSDSKNYDLIKKYESKLSNVIIYDI